MSSQKLNYHGMACMYETIFHLLISIRELIPEDDDQDFLDHFDKAISAAEEKIHDYMNAFNACDD